LVENPKNICAEDFIGFKTQRICVDNQKQEK